MSRQFLLLLALTACAPEYVGDGDILEDVRYLQSFDGIHTWGGITTTITAGQEASVTIRVDRNLSRFLLAEVTESILEVGGERGRPLQPTHLELLVTLPVLDTLILDGWGPTTVDNLSADILSIDHVGDGPVRLQGSANELSLMSKGDGDLDGRRLVLLDTDFDIRGSGNSWLYITRNVSGSFSGDGTIFLLGTPQEVDIRDYGKGVVRGPLE